MFNSLFLVPSLSLSPWLVLDPLLLLQTASDCVVHVPIKRVHCISDENVCQSTLASILNSLTAFIPSILISTVTFTDTTNKGLTCSNSNSSSLVTAALILSCINVIKILTIRVIIYLHKELHPFQMPIYLSRFVAKCTFL